MRSRLLGPRFFSVGRAGRRGLGLGLDEEAVAAIESWAFAPAMKGGRSVAVAATVEVNFRLL